MKSQKKSDEKKSKEEEVIEKKKEVEMPPTKKEEVRVSEKNDSKIEDYTDLMQAIIDKVDKVMVRSILKKNAMIDSIEGDLLTIIIINEQYYNSMQKTETIQYMQDIISEIRGTTTSLKWIYMSKEDYLKKALS